MPKPFPVECPACRRMTEAADWSYVNYSCKQCVLTADWHACSDCGYEGTGFHACQAPHVQPDDEQKPETD
jgi:hypothetical protein